MTIIEQIFQAGIVGCGGAGFPTHAKLKGDIRHLIINGAECEPLLRTDHYVMKHRAKEIVTAIDAVRSAIGLETATIALKGSYIEEIAALEAAIAETGAAVSLYKMQSFYPAGDEQVIVYEVTGRVVPPAGIPLDVGAVVFNVATMLSVHDAMSGKPLIYKYLTVTGEVNNPVVLYVPVGTSFEECIRLAGGATRENYYVISGGPMMGTPLTKAEVAQSVVIKTTSGMILVPEDGYLASQRSITLEHMFNRASSACIQCSYCTQLCPRYLMGHPLEPHRIMRKMAMAADTHQLSNLLDDPDIRGAALCCECGVCEIYACPMELQPRRVNVTLKKALREAGIRYPKGEEEYTARTTREYRKAPTKRAAARAGVTKYYDYRIDTLVDYTPVQVCIPVRQHIGAPAQPVVSVGDYVAAGQLIARCPQDQLGANIHASISGRVCSVGDQIVIEG